VRVLIVGAGVIGSFNAARLKEAGHDVSLVARGRRLADLREHGVVLEDYGTGRRSTVQVPLVDRLGPDDTYDLAIVVVRRNQRASVLPMLAQNRRIPSVLFVGNNAAGPQDLVAALGPDRVLIGLANAAGERTGHVVRYVWSRWLSLPFNEWDGRPTPRTDTIVGLFQSAGLRAHVQKNMDAYLKTHAAGLPPFAGALYRVGGDVRRLGHTPEALRLFVRSYREGLRALRSVGVSVTPSAVQLVEWVPEPILMLALRFFFDTRLAVVGGERHANAAVDEMKELVGEFREILRRAGRPCPASDILYAEVDKRFQTSAMPGAASKDRPTPART
jgi:2-dehydropantoate 2-reductase